MIDDWLIGKTVLLTQLLIEASHLSVFRSEIKAKKKGMLDPDCWDGCLMCDRKSQARPSFGGICLFCLGYFPVLVKDRLG